MCFVLHAWAMPAVWCFLSMYYLCQYVTRCQVLQLLRVYVNPVRLCQPSTLQHYTRDMLEASG